MLKKQYLSIFLFTLLGLGILPFYSSQSVIASEYELATSSYFCFKTNFEPLVVHDLHVQSKMTRFYAESPSTLLERRSTESNEFFVSLKKLNIFYQAWLSKSLIDSCVPRTSSFQRLPFKFSKEFLLMELLSSIPHPPTA